jgi:hypothetical protein
MGCADGKKIDKRRYLISNAIRFTSRLYMFMYKKCCAIRLMLIIYWAI